MSGLLKDNQSLSYYLKNAIERVKEDAVDRTKSGMLHTYHQWKNMAIKQEQEITAMKKHFSWMTDRLVHVYHEEPNLDYIKKARELTKDDDQT